MTARPTIIASKTFTYTVLALIAFAANSVLCRLALGTDTIDAPSFTAIRLLSGIITLFLILQLRNNNKSPGSKGSWVSGGMLFLYAVTFSYAYITLDTATGALILFGTVQLTMIMVSLYSGQKLHFTEWLGVFMAFAGFVYLVLPGITTPSVTGFLLMTVAGIAWGFYTLNGRGSMDPLADTFWNFYRTLPLVIVLVIITVQNSSLSSEGVLLAILSGAVASGMGYAIWYSALKGLSITQAAVVQLAVPVIAAFGGVLFVNEAISLRLILSAAMILGGILLVILGRNYFKQA